MSNFPIDQDADTTTVWYNVTVTTDAGTVVQHYARWARENLAEIADKWSADDLHIEVVQVTEVVRRTNESLGVLTVCPFDHAHTASWCGHLQCRQS